MTLVRLLSGRNRDLAHVRVDVDKIFESIFNNRPFYSETDATEMIAPPVDVEETAEGYVFRADLPGFSEKDLKVSLVGDTLKLRGERKRESDTQSGEAHRTERAFGAFERTFTLPKPVRADQVKASYRNGVLEVRVPKADEARVREIEVQVG